MDLQPVCAQPCIASAMLAVGCQVNDQSCGCKPTLQDEIGSLAASCLIQNCPATQLVEVGNAGRAGCSAYSLTYMYGMSTMGSATISLTSSLPSSTLSTISTPSSAGTVVRMTGSSMSSPTSFPAATSSVNPSPHPISRLSTASTVGIGVGACALLCIIALAVLCCLRHRRANFKEIKTSDSEIFALVGNHELETQSVRHEMSGRNSWIRPPEPMYELASETSTNESLRSEPTHPSPPPRVSTPDREKRQPASPPPQIIIQLAEEFPSPESIRKPKRLRKMERTSNLRE